MKTESYPAMNMGPRNLLILFFSAVAVSLVILIILSSLVFKNLSLDFNTHMPESTPEIGHQFNTQTQSMNPESKADSVSRSTLNVPPETAEPPVAVGNDKTDLKKNKLGGSTENAPVSDDSVLENNSPLPMEDTIAPDETPPAALPSGLERSTAGKTITPPPRNPRPASKTTHRNESFPTAPPPMDDNNSSEPNGPPVPGQ
jgi:hypothetical protein